MKEIQIADWVQKIAGDKAPLDDLREWEHRVVAAYSELLDGYKADIDAILNDIARVRDYPGLVLEQGINFTSICYHHFLPFFGTIDVAYEPGEIITGLGRIVQLVQALAHRLQIQEFLVRDIAETLKERVAHKECLSVRGRSIYASIRGDQATIRWKRFAPMASAHSRKSSDRRSCANCWPCNRDEAAGRAHERDQGVI